MVFIELRKMTKLMKAREKAKISQAELSKASGVPQPTISGSELGGEIGVWKAIKIVKALKKLGLKCTVESVFGEKPVEPKV